MRPQMLEDPGAEPGGLQLAGALPLHPTLLHTLKSISLTSVIDILKLDGHSPITILINERCRGCCKKKKKNYLTYKISLQFLRGILKWKF